MASDAVRQVWAANDTSSFNVSAAAFLGPSTGRNPGLVEARLTEQFITANQEIFAKFDTQARAIPTSSGRINLGIRTGSRIGAMPLKSPTTGRIDFGLLIRPRFGWAGVGPLLTATGAKVVPSLLRMPNLPRAEMGVPPWVISSVVLWRLQRLLRQTKRQFAQVSRIEDRPRGRVDWHAYATRHMAVGRPDQLPCVYSALEEDANLLGAVHSTALKQLRSLRTVRTDTQIVRRLINEFEDVLNRVRWAPPRWNVVVRPQNIDHSEILRDALEAMQWTYEERGLAGLSPLHGLPWILSMEEVFEAWVETVVRALALRSGGIVRCGRLRETLRPIAWAPPYAGSQRFLLPDVELLRQGETIVFDAKYKSHWEEIDERRWHGVNDQIRESHRADVLQVLAYGAATDTERVSCVLLYPCKESTWQSLRTRNRLIHTSEIPAGRRSVRLILMAIPLGHPVEELATVMSRQLFSDGLVNSHSP